MKPVVPILMAVTNAARGLVSRYRVPIIIASALIFGGGIVLSARSLALDIASLDLAYVALLFALVPFSFVYGALNMQVMARSAGTGLSFGAAFRTASMAQFAEFLPIPGGAIVRGEALWRSGVAPALAAAHVLVNALLWLAIAAFAGGVVLDATTPVGLLLALGGGIAAIACTAWLVRKAGWPIAAIAFGLRVVGLGFVTFRLLAAFFALSLSMTLIDTLPFAFAIILGSASSITPGGLGISELVAAGIADLAATAPAAAFLAVAFNRLVGFAMSGLLTLFFVSTAKLPEPSVG